MDDRKPVERVEEAGIGERGPLRDRIRGLGDGLGITELRLLHGAGQNQATTPSVGAGEHQIDRRQEVRPQHREHKIAVARAAHFARQMEDDVRPQPAQQSLNG